MHVIFRESHGLEESETPIDLGQTPADLVVLSFSDSDLGAFAAGWHRGGGAQGRLPSLRLANLAALKHPLSVDTYVEQTLEGAKGILIRLIGGIPYWSYGIQSVQALAQRKGIALAVLPADGREDARLDAVSTLPLSTLRRLAHLCDTGGEVAAQAALSQMALAAGLYAGPVAGDKTLPTVGAWTPEHGVCAPLVARGIEAKPLVIVTFYRAYLTAADLDPIKKLFAELRQAGFAVMGLFAPSLKAPDAANWLRRQVTFWAPKAIINATSFSGKGADGTSPLDAANVPVFQVALATSTREAWAEADRGLSPADLAMHVVLPEVDGRLTGGVVSFKEPGVLDEALEFSRYAHQGDFAQIKAVVSKVKNWTRLADKAEKNRQIALVLSTYPGRDWNMAHAVGLDAIASAEAMLRDLKESGYSVEAEDNLTSLSAASVLWPIEEYKAALAALPTALQTDLQATWGAPEDDPEATVNHISFRVIRSGNALVALQPERGTPSERDAEYHDLSRTPRHAYVAFYLWLQSQVDALVHIGAHGTLEWLPGKAVALSGACWPEVLTGDLPVIYPFIVNDPGEAAQAKRRIGAVTLGHIPPPLKTSGTPERLSRLEALLDEFSNADGLDPKRRDRLQDDIREEAQALGVEDDLGLDRASCAAEAITRIDRFVCDVKDSQFGDGLHVWGRPGPANDSFETAASVEAERTALLSALNGERIEAGPSGSPYRGRNDVLPTGRNLYTTDPRAVPTRAAYTQGVALAEELIRRHLQDEGDWPRNLVVDLWGSSTMRTAGEDFAMALHLIGVKPVWDDGSERVSGVEVIPLAEIDRPRLDVTLRVSGLFRDVFPGLSGVFAQAVRVLADRDEAADYNPFVGQSPRRVYGPKPGSYGAGIAGELDVYTDEARKAAGEAWLAASAWALDGDKAEHDAQGLRAQVVAATAFVHTQDLPETDILLASDYATHEAGFAAAQAVTGGAAQLYHIDNTRPETPRARSLKEEVARVVQARAANPEWIAGMRRHGFRGAAEIAATLEHMAAFAHLAQAVDAHHFDAYYEATLGEAEVAQFMQEANPEAYEAMQSRFAALHDAGLWVSRRNSILATLGAAE